MHIVVGTKNPAKIAAVSAVFENATVEGKQTDSHVSAQPFSDLETMQGAINRAIQCSDAKSGIIGIGLEGGVMQLDDKLYLCNWGALAVSDAEIYTAGGDRIVLPDEVAKQLKPGVELGDVMERFAHKNDVRKKEGAIGIFTNERVSRKDMFTHIVSLLYGQLEFHRKQKAQH